MIENSEKLDAMELASADGAGENAVEYNEDSIQVEVRLTVQL